MMTAWLVEQRGRNHVPRREGASISAVGAAETEKDRNGLRKAENQHPRNSNFYLLHVRGKSRHSMESMRETGELGKCGREFGEMCRAQIAGRWQSETAAATIVSENQAGQVGASNYSRWSRVQ